MYRFICDSLSLSLSLYIYTYQTITGKNPCPKNRGKKQRVLMARLPLHRLPDFESQDMDLDERKDSNPNPRANVGSAGGNCIQLQPFFCCRFFFFLRTSFARSFFLSFFLFLILFLSVFFVFLIFEHFLFCSYFYGVILLVRWDVIRICWFGSQKTAGVIDHSMMILNLFCELDTRTKNFVKVLPSIAINILNLYDLTYHHW